MVWRGGDPRREAGGDVLDEKEADERLAAARALLNPCRVCPRRCGVNRLAGETGFCGAGPEAVVASAGPHFGEEDCLVGQGGSGTIFLAGCNLGCAFCQNSDISRSAAGEEMGAAALARRMLLLESRGCENINFVTPTHFSPAILAAVVEARRRGLRVPVVWNSGGYELPDVIRLADGIVEIYMPDFKFSRAASARRYCDAPDYPESARASLAEMHRQVGDLAMQGGVAVRGLLVRHLVMPGGAAESREVLDFLASISPRTFVNVMGQYRPEGAVLDPRWRARYAEIARRPAAEEIAEVRAYARSLGLRLAET
jgi:putative pyruvate formate lyase activating enzyme